MGLSAAKEQQSEPKKSQPSVSVTVTKSPASSAKSPFLAQAEQHNLLLKQQQQLQQQLLQQQQAIKMSQPTSAAAAHVQRKTYEAMIADISKVADFSAKISSYSHEAKVTITLYILNIRSKVIFSMFNIFLSIYVYFYLVKLPQLTYIQLKPAFNEF